MTRVAGVTPLPAELAPRPDHLSYSQVAKLSSHYRLSCPRQWAYSRLLGLESPPSAAMLCGTALDRGVMSFLIARMGGKHLAPATADAFDACRTVCAEAAWPDLSRAAGYADIVEAGLLAFIENHTTLLPATVQAEHAFAVTGSDGEPVKVIGFSDWIEADGTIVDLKWSGTPRWNRDGEWLPDWLGEKRDQVAMYWLARRAAAYQPGAVPRVLPAAPVVEPPVVPRARICVVQMKLGQKQPQVRSVDLTFTAEDEHRLVAMIREADDIARGAVHPPRPGEACAFCSFVDRCRHDNARLAAPTQALVEAA